MLITALIVNVLGQECHWDDLKIKPCQPDKKSRSPLQDKGYNPSKCIYKADKQKQDNGMI